MNALSWVGVGFLILGVLIGLLSVYKPPPELEPADFNPLQALIEWLKDLVAGWITGAGGNREKSLRRLSAICIAIGLILIVLDLTVVGGGSPTPSPTPS